LRHRASPLSSFLHLTGFSFKIRAQNALEGYGPFGGLEYAQTAYDTKRETQVKWRAMYWPDYNPRKKRRGSLMVPMILFGLLLGVLLGFLSGFLPGESFFGWLNWTPAAAHAPAEAATTITPAQAVVVEEIVVATPVPTIAALSSDKLALAPDFVLPDLFNDSLNRSLVDYSGRPVILNFWASWCVPCKEEMPALQRAYEKNRDAGLIVLGINQTFVDDLDAAREFVYELSLTFPNVRDDTGNTSEGLYGVMGLPTSVFITPDGEIARKQIGQMTDEQIETFSQQLVAGKAIRP
jgi:thiol-disulfide isomerase/thioredoxin